MKNSSAPFRGEGLMEDTEAADASKPEDPLLLSEHEKTKSTSMLWNAVAWNAFLFCVFVPIASAAWYMCERDAFLARSESSKQGSWVSILEKLNAEERTLLTSHINDTAFAQALKEVPTPATSLKPLAFWNVYAFVGVSITSIGFGDITPITPHGKILTVFICLFGMPMAVQSICKSGELLYQVLIDWPLYAYSIRPQSIRRRFALVTCYCALYWMVGILFYSYTMDWTVLDCAYYIFIATSTVGYGDYIPTGKFYIGDLLFMVFGLNLMTLFFQVQQQVGEKQLRKLERIKETVTARVDRLQ
jgi:hypothetical protein